MNDFLIKYLDGLKEIFLYPELELRILLNKSSIKDKEIILSNFKYEDIDIFKFKKFFKRRINKEPISKILNSKSFWKYDFFVNHDVLDPRPETELIIENILRIYRNKNKVLKILDICTGSGCLAISLAKEYPQSKIIATDISKKAIDIAKKNAINLGCINQIKFVQCDLLSKIQLYDIVVSNPPYLSKVEFDKTSAEIKLYEPEIALVALNDGYEFYEKISNILNKILKKNSNVFLEIGSSQAKKVIKIFNYNNITCLKLVKDLQYLDRMLILNKS